MEGSFKIPNLPKNKPEEEKANQDKSEQASESIYVEPEWAAVPKKSYTLTEIKTGCETAKWKLTKSCLKIGRSNSNDLIMLHNSVSRHHAVVQSGMRDEQEVVFIYDMGTTHGTYLNKTRIPPNEYIQLKDGYIFKFAGSTRIYLFEEDKGDDSGDQMTQPMGGESNADEESYVDWGIGDKDEASDPYSDRNIFAFNEDEELDRPDFDPIKALDLWFEQEGIRPSYKFEASAGNTLFQCSVTLPLEDITNEEEGNMTITGKADKKSIAKRQAALDCCKYLTNLGYRLVEKKSKNWEQNDYYDSDEDPFLDRTGDLEKKRAQRKIKQDKAKTVEEFLTFEKLAEKHNNLVNRVLKEDTNFRNAMRHLDEQKKKYEQDETQKEVLSIIDRDIEKLKAGHRARLTEIDAEIKQNEMLMQLAKPALPAIGMKDEVVCQKIDIQLYMPAVTKMNLGPSTSGVGVKSGTQKTGDQRTTVTARDPDEWTDSPVKKRKITLPVKIVLKVPPETAVNEANKNAKEKSSEWKNEEK